MQRKCSMRNLKQSSKLLQSFILLVLGLEIVFYLFCNDIYLQISGFYIPLVVMTIASGIWLLKNYWRFNEKSVPFLIFFVAIFLASFDNIQNNEKGYFFSYILLVFMALVLTTMDLDEKEKSFLFHCYLISGYIIACIIGVVQYRYYELETRYTIKIGDNPAIDPNYLAGFLIGPFFMSLYYVFKEKYVARKIIYAISACVIGFGVFLTESRGGLLSVGVIFLYLLIKEVVKKLKKKEIIILFTFLLGLIAIVFVLMPKDTLQRMFNIFTWLDGSNKKRFYNWNNAARAIAYHPLFGFGLAETGLSFMSVTGVYGVAHNTVLELWGQLGILAIVALVQVGILLFSHKGNSYGQALFIGNMVVSLFISCEATLVFWINIAFCLIMSKKGVNNERDDEFFNQCYHTSIQCRNLPRRVLTKYLRTNV